MSKDPAFLFYSKDWLEGTAEMSPEEKGVYIDLLCYHHQRGSLPNDTKRLATMVGLKQSQFKKSWTLLNTKFTTNSTGELINKKLISIGNERTLHSQMRKIIGTFGSLLRSLNVNKSTYEKIKKLFNYKDFIEVADNLLSKELSIWLTKNLPKASQTIEDGDAIGIEDKYNMSGFEVFWKAYPKKKSKGDAEKWWIKNLPNNSLVEQMILSIKKLKESDSWKNEGGKYIPHPSSWLNSKGWEDEIGIETVERVIIPRDAN